MQCSKEALVRLFYNLSSSFLLLLLFLYTSSILLAKLFYFIGSYPLIQRTQNGYDFSTFSEEEEEEEEFGAGSYNYREVNCIGNDHLVADIIHGGQSLLFLSDSSFHMTQNDDVDDSMNPHDGQPTSTEDQEYASYSTEHFSAHDLSPCSDSEHHHRHDDVDDTESVDEEISAKDADSLQNFDVNQDGPSPNIDSEILTEVNKSDQVDNDEDEITNNQEIKQRVETDFSTTEKCFVIAPTKLESKKLLVHGKDDEEIYGDSCTNGSTSKGSSEWRSSINCRDSSGTDDPFSSSSRRSCPKWESYTVFQKYDEEMMFLHRVSAQKLQETESLRSIQFCPRSISGRIVQKIATMNKRPSSDMRQNPYHELEAAYVAQICLTWEALNWNYKNFERKRAALKDFDCSASIAQQFQQFQVLLQRYIENEPYEQGRRPEVYARVKQLAPKLLLVPEYRDYEDDQRDEGFGSRISADSFLVIMEEGIHTFMNFLKSDKEKPYQIIKALFGRKRRGSVDPKLVQRMKKVNVKKKMKLKELRRTNKCLRKREHKVEKELEILMGLIDLKVVSRALRMSDLSEQQLHWCEEKMSKVRILEGRLQRDSSPLFFPAH